MKAEGIIDCSVIIPAFNAERTIMNAINSVGLHINTEYSYEIIVVDDGSSDNTAGIINEYDNDRVRVITKNNGGVSSARNVGINLAKGRFIYFMDADDEVNRKVLDEMIKIGYREAVDIILADYEALITVEDRVIPNKINLIQSTVLDKRYCIEHILPRLILNDSFGLIPIWNKVYSTDFIRRNFIFFDEKRDHGEDWVYNMLCFEKANFVYYINKTLYKYTISRNQSLEKYNKKSVGYGFLESYKISISLIKKYSFINYDSLIIEKATLGFAYNIVQSISIDSCSRPEIKALLARQESKEIFSFLSKMDNDVLQELSLSRKEKIAFSLLKHGLYSVALRLLK